MFKVGDCVQSTFWKTAGQQGIIRKPSKDAQCWLIEGFSNDGVMEGGYPVYNEMYLKLIESSLTNNQMGIKEAFVLALTSEPKKSFRKAGITNGDDLLTDEGQKIFLTWLLHNKFSDEFKTSVVDGLLADQKQS